LAEYNTHVVVIVLLVQPGVSSHTVQIG
jgi:hypothetical protein